MAKIICDNARVATATEDNPRVDIECRKDCPICQGAGYTEAEVVEVGKVEAAWLDCHREANSGTDVVMAFNSWLDNLKEAK